MGSIPVRKLRSYMSCGVAKKQTKKPNQTSEIKQTNRKMAVGENETCEKSKHREEKITTTPERADRQDRKSIYTWMIIPSVGTGNTRLDEAVTKKNQLGIKGVNEEMMNSVGRSKGRRTNEWTGRSQWDGELREDGGEKAKCSCLSINNMSARGRGKDQQIRGNIWKVTEFSHFRFLPVTHVLNAFNFCQSSGYKKYFIVI